MPLDWASGCENSVMWVSCEGFKYLTLALLTTILEDHLREVKGACSKTRGRSELLNLKCSINYEIVGPSSSLEKGKAHAL